MAENDQSGQERTEQATPKRLREAKEKGQVARSRELNTMIGLLAAAGGLSIFKDYMGDKLSEVMRQGLTHTRAELLDPHYMIAELHADVLRFLSLLAPFMAVALVAALGAPLLLGGWSFSFKAMAFKAEKLNPFKGLKKLFSLKGALEVVKALGKFAIIGFVTWKILMYFAPEFRHLGLEPLSSAIAHGTHIVIVSFFLLGAGLVAIALADAPFQLWDHARQLKMTRQEVRDEHKETEGRPEVKGRIRSLQQQASQRRMMTDIPNADVVVTNPTHYAVALRYDEETMRAPKVVAKGADHMAAQIRTIAAEHDVPLLTAPPLARALYASTRLGNEIPSGLYVAVAQVLTYIFRLKSAGDLDDNMPEAPNPEIDPEFQA